MQDSGQNGNISWAVGTMHLTKCAKQEAAGFHLVALFARLTFRFVLFRLWFDLHHRPHEVCKAPGVAGGMRSNEVEEFRAGSFWGIRHRVVP